MGINEMDDGTDFAKNWSSPGSACQVENEHTNRMFFWAGDFFGHQIKEYIFFWKPFV